MGNEQRSCQFLNFSNAIYNKKALAILIFHKTSDKNLLKLTAVIYKCINSHNCPIKLSFLIRIQLHNVTAEVVGSF